MIPSRRHVKIAAVLAALAGLVVARQLGVLDAMAEPERLARALVDLGPWGWLAFVVAYAALQPFGVPGTVFIVAAPLIWPWPLAFALSMTGTMAASVVGFSFARLVAKEWVTPRIPARAQRYADALERRAFATVLVLRFVLWMPPWLHAFFGVSKVPASTHFWASLVGYAPPILVVSYFGRRWVDAARSAPPGVWIAALGVTAALGATTLVVRRLRARGARTERTV